MKFFSTTKFKPREFNYKPRFYDADKEELDRRIKIRGMSNNKGDITKSRLRKEFGNLKSGQATQKSLLGASSFRLVLIIIALSIASYFVLDNWLPKLMNNWFPEEDTESYEFLEEYDEGTE